MLDRGPDLNTSLNKAIYLTGDTATDPAHTIPGIQPCPVCDGGTCIGGPNNGMACVPGSSDLGDAFPTSHDCPPDSMLFLGNAVLLLPTAQASTSTISWEGTLATNDTGGTVSVQNRVFCGFCRDANNTAAFENPAHACHVNGMAVGAACTEPFETCEQRTVGAFGPNGGAVRTLTVNGAPAGDLSDLNSHPRRWGASSVSLRSSMLPPMPRRTSRGRAR